MGIEPPTLVRHLDKLADDGLVERRPDPDDRRVVRVVVSKAGRKRLAQLHAVVHDLDTELRSVLSAREVHALQHGLAHVYEHFNEEVRHGRN